MGLVHRDVSPQNVLISDEGDIKLCDFGIAKAASKASHTQAGALKGKLQYMSPEQAWGRPIDKRSDIFALATVLFEMLTARRLFGGDNELSILEQVREARVTAPSLVNDEVTAAIDQIVLKALQKEPANRYQTAGEMQRDIDAVLYTFKPTPTSADLAIYMHRLNTAEPSPARVDAPLVHEPEPEPLPANELRPIAVPPPPPTPAPVIDTTKVNEEVQKRLAAQKTRLEQQARQQTTTQAPVLGRTTPAPQPQPVATQTVAPATQTVAPPPQPVVPAPQPVAPAPVPAPEPQVQRAQLGELVPSGTEGLNPARISHQAAATYPPIARMQRMQGTVIGNAL